MEEKKEMNIIVAVFLIALIFINLFSAFSSLELSKAIIKYENVSPFCAYGLVASKLVYCVFIAFLFRWSMWGFYGLLAVSLVQFVILLMMKAEMLTACYPFIYLAIVYFVLQISQKGESAWDNLE
ncbi:hypothetical protein EYY60_00915 [Flavobacterium zhairuonense]|uniref:hypothetical protein n=1 Tax=Flavobacterium zhairuonense TaxID=2493631 RepID=UPI001050FC39|nr:hypothetical protein [Flavobacterium zhairuonense]KAF2516769.1 hypothetical protein EYY60_00915 [Flavobacterium zhairuonense]